MGRAAACLRSADDVPGILRAIADGDEETAKEAASELFGNIWHQGTVCLALADVLARTAADPEAGLDAISLLRQLGPVPDAADAIFAVADRTGPERTADEALACLLEWGDLRAEIRRFLANSEKFSGARPE